MNTNYLRDQAFLQKLCSNYYQTKYVRIISLNFNENPIEEIAGKITGGSISIDGASAIRRTCNLTMTADLKNNKITDYYWTLGTKFSLQIGLKNNINTLYPKIIWFPMGLYLITSFNCNENTTSYNISLSGQDKMCLLNGEVSGLIPAETDFGQVDEEQSDGTFITTKLLLKDIIINAVHTYGKEPLSNIFINDLEQEEGLNLLEYQGDEPLYLFYNANTETNNSWWTDPQIVNYTIYGDQQVQVQSAGKIALKNLPSFYKPANLVDQNISRGTIFTLGGQPYAARRVESGQLCGYEKTDLIYAGDLVAAAGENLVTGVLDKIKNMLGNYEYFYDEYGHFIFQKKKTYLQNTWSLMGDNILNFINLEEYIYTFKDSSLFTSIGYNPDLKKIKNDFTVWGKRKSITNEVEIPIHMRLVIDKKPQSYASPYQNYFLPQADGSIKAILKENKEPLTSKLVDWRELIYQMALDWQAHHTESNFISKLREYNPKLLQENNQTGYEDYYTDFLTFWRELYNPFSEDIYTEIDWAEAPKRDDGSGNKLIYTYTLETLDPNGDLWDNVNAEDIYVKRIINGKTYNIPWIDTFNLDQTESIIYDISNLYIYNPKTEEYRLYLNSLDFDYKTTQVKIRGEDDNYYPIIVNEQVINNANISPNFIYYEQDKAMVPYVKWYDIFHLPAEISHYRILCDGLYFQPSSTSNQPVALEWAEETSQGRNVKMTWEKDMVEENETMVRHNFQWNQEDLTMLQNVSNRSLDYFQLYYSAGSSRVITPNSPVYLQYFDLPQDTTTYSNIYYSVDNIDFTPLAQQLVETRILSLKDYYVGEDNHLVLDSYNIDKTQLYIKLENGEFELLSKYAKENRLFINESDQFYRQTKSLINTATRRTEYFQFYKCDWRGQVNTTIAYPQKNHYFVINTKYNPINSNHDAYLPNRIPYWHRNVEDCPELLNFWFDIIDTVEAKELAPYACSAIGHRPIVKNETSVTAIYYPNTPSAYFGTSQLCLTDMMKQFFTISSLGQSAYNYIDQLLYDHTYLSENVTLSAIPLYWLQPNRKIQIFDLLRGLHDDFIINKITIPLEYGGLMNLNVIKCSSIGLNYINQENLPPIQDDDSDNIVYDGGGLDEDTSDNIYDGGELEN